MTDKDTFDEDEVFDLDALQAERDEKPFRFKFDGDYFELPTVLDFRLVDQLEESQTSLRDIMCLLLGDEQWEYLNSKTAVLSIDTMMDLVERYAKRMGISLGKSAGSTSSSRRMVEPSKRTSNGITRSRSRT